MTIPNPALHEHVTATAFTLVLRKTQIAALAWLDHELRLNESIEDQLKAGTLVDRRPPRTRVWSLFVTGVGGLTTRGLVEHILPSQYQQPGTSTTHLRPDQCWRITTAGRHVIGLLAEAGIWQQYTRDLPAPEPATGGTR